MRSGAVNAQAERRSDQAFDILYQAITRCELAPGEVVSEPQIGLMFGLGRVGIRLAMDRLIQLQLVTPLHRRGFEIAPIRVADVRNTFELRLLVEPPAIRTAVGRGVDVKQLRMINARTLGPAKPGDRVAEANIINANREFHLRIIEACGNDKITTLVRQILNDIDRVYYFGLVRHPQFGAMRQQHSQMLDAIEAGDADGAARVAREHIEIGYNIVMDAIMENVTFAGATAARPISSRNNSSSLKSKARQLLD